MSRALALLIIGLVFGGGIGFVLGAAPRPIQEAVPAMEHAEHGHAHGETLVLATDDSAPSLDIRLLPDPVAGWNLNIVTRWFRFAPEHAGEAHVPGEGHAHVYVNGSKIARVYGAWFHLETLPPGKTEIEVTLTSNDHRSLVVGDRPLSRTVTLDVPG